MLISDDNFGCGSSREHAVWALKDFGINVVIASSFGDIFFNNCFKNGILAIVLSEKDRDALMEDAQNTEKSVLAIDLENQKILRSNGDSLQFEVDDFKKYC